MIHRNVGTLDRAVRVALGIILFPLGLFLLAAKSGYGLWVAIAGLIGLATGLIGFCGLYNTCRSASPRRARKSWRRADRDTRLRTHDRLAGGFVPGRHSRAQQAAAQFPRSADGKSKGGRIPRALRGPADLVPRGRSRRDSRGLLSGIGVRDLSGVRIASYRRHPRQDRSRGRRSHRSAPTDDEFPRRGTPTRRIGRTIGLGRRSTIPRPHRMREPLLADALCRARSPNKFAI